MFSNNYYNILSAQVSVYLMFSSPFAQPSCSLPLDISMLKSRADTAESLSDKA
jgi:hypothetical protein